jgi:hypothetical protein
MLRSLIDTNFVMKSVCLKALPHFRLLDIWFGYTLKLHSIIKVHKFPPILIFTHLNFSLSFYQEALLRLRLLDTWFDFRNIGNALLLFLKLKLDFHHAYFVFEFFFIYPQFGHMFWNKFEFFLNSIFLFCIWIFCFVEWEGERIVNKNSICEEISSREKKKNRKRKEKQRKGKRNLKGKFES